MTANGTHPTWVQFRAGEPRHAIVGSEPGYVGGTFHAVACGLRTAAGAWRINKQARQCRNCRRALRAQKDAPPAPRIGLRMERGGG